MLILPTVPSPDDPFSSPASPDDPFSSPASIRISADAGGMPISSVTFFLSSTMTLTGTCIPLYDAVFAFMSSTTALMLIPRGPRAGPIGGPGLAFPPGTNTSITSAMLFALLLAQDPHVIAAYCNWYRDHSLEE